MQTSILLLIYMQGYALEILEHLQGTDAWKFEGLVVGSPAFQLSSSHATTPLTKIEGELVLRNQIELSANQAQAFVEFLTAQESLLKRISSYEKENAKQAFRKICRLIAAYGRRIREGKRREGRESIEGKESKIIPTPILNGSYFTVYQAAQVYRSTSKEIRAWIRKGKLEALNLPDLGIVIETEKLNEFLYEIRSIQDAPRPERSHEP